MTAPPIAVACHGISKSYDSASQPALADVSFSITAGEKVALLGANGAGKSTLLGICAGLLAPDTGSVSLNGRDPSCLHRRQQAQLVGLMPQRLNLVGPLRAKHNIQAGLLGRWGFWSSLGALALPAETPAVQELAEQLQLTDKLAQRTFTLSGGEQQRVALARLLLQNPAIMLADEPVASLDINLAETALKRLTEDANKTALLSLHNPAHAQSYASRIIGLRAGSLVFDLPADEVTQQHLEQIYGPGSHL